MKRRLMLPWVVVLATGCANAPVDYRAQADADLLHDALQNLTDVIVYDIFSPPQASRAYSYAGVAAYEALRHDHVEYRTLAGQLNGLEPVPQPEPDAQLFLPLASVHAFMTVGRALTFSQERMDSLRAAMHERFRRMGVPRSVFQQSIAYGDTVAKHILAWASKDGFVETRGYPKYTVVSEPGRWIPTPPAYMDAVEPHWWRLRPFVLDSSSQFRPPPPVPFDMSEGSAFRREVMEVYETGRSLTEEQRAIAAFWDCNPYVMHVRGHAMFATKKISPGGHWMSIATIASRQSGADLMKTAETYVLTAMALADGFISNWEEKYRSNLVRPETVINEQIDEGWQPLLQTPPFPEYTSGHSVISNSAAEVLTHLYGDGFAFDDTSEEPFGLPSRWYPSFRSAAAEAAISRMYGGIHYRMAVEAGIEQGQAVGRLIASRVQTRAAGSVAQHAGGARH
ncbi:MAG TPA: vanadium-dependent haloperoxidase [Longimicrobiales bacterium]